MPSDSQTFSKLAEYLIGVFAIREKEINDEKITVNDLVSKLASYYEKLRTAMDYGSEETIPRRAMERMLKRMLFLDEDIKSLSIAKDLVRELIWAGYFPNATVSESIIHKVSDSISLYFNLRDRLIKAKILPRDKINEFILQLLSCDIFFTLIPNKEKEAVSNFMFQVLKNSVEIEDETKQIRDIQVFIAVRKSFIRDDIAFLRYKLFSQLFGKVTVSNLDEVTAGFKDGYTEIKQQLSYPKKERILNHIKKETPPFLILYDLLAHEQGNIKSLVKDKDEFKKRVYALCNRRYASIKRKVRTAIVRSFIFILFTKAIFAFAIEGAYESVFFGKIQWLSIILNTIFPPLIMAGVGISINTPNEKNSALIFDNINKLLFEENPTLSNVANIKLKSGSKPDFKDFIFSLLWFLSIGLTFGLIWYVLGILQFNFLSKSIFVFFIAIISFLSYRIYQTANSYTIAKKQNLFTPIFEFFFIPVIRVGRKLTEGISQINFILLIIDFIIEAPFKGLIGFFEQWFLYVSNKREELE